MGVAGGGVDLGRRCARRDDRLLDPPAAALAIGERCRARRIPLVVGTTGLDAGQRRELEASAADIPVLISPNMSRAVNVLMKLVGEAARVLGASADVEIVERHHRTKKDAPSGTALRLGEMAGRGLSASRLIAGVPGPVGVRQPGEIGIHALRVADCPGEHQVVFSLMGETLELSHRALNRDGFAGGAGGRTIPRRQDAGTVHHGGCPGLTSGEGIRSGGVVMAGCERGYICAGAAVVEVEEIHDSGLYLRFVLGEVRFDQLDRLPERHIRCDPTLSQFIVAEGFDPVVAEGPFAKAGLDPRFVADEEQRVTRGFAKLQDLSTSDVLIWDYPIRD